MTKLNFSSVFLILPLIVFLANAAISRNEPRGALQPREPRKVGNSRRIAYCDDQTKAIANDEERDSQWDSLRGSVPLSQFRCPYQSGRYGRPGNCHSYYQCTEGKACLGLCSPTEIFDVRSGQCLPEGDGSTCYEEEGFNCPKKSGVYRHDRRCDRFIKCRYGQSYLVYCRLGEKFDVEVQRCVPEVSAVCQEVKGGERVIEEVVNFAASAASVKHLVDAVVSASVALPASGPANCSCL